MTSVPLSNTHVKQTLEDKSTIFHPPTSKKSAAKDPSCTQIKGLSYKAYFEFLSLTSGPYLPYAVEHVQGPSLASTAPLSQANGWRGNAMNTQPPPLSPSPHSTLPFSPNQSTSEHGIIHSLRSHRETEHWLPEQPRNNPSSPAPAASPPSPFLYDFGGRKPGDAVPIAAGLPAAPPPLRSPFPTLWSTTGRATSPPTSPFHPRGSARSNRPLVPEPGDRRRSSFPAVHRPTPSISLISGATHRARAVDPTLSAAAGSTSSSPAPSEPRRRTQNAR
uniref:Uncharacterized protein n=1 Tax=Leersia perrieri TaxID=77586 RepID=A0A0D9VX63_9ORYZ